MRILFPTDLSAESHETLELIKQLIKRYQAEVYFFHVISPLYHIWASSRLYWNEVRQRLYEWQLTVDAGDKQKLLIATGDIVENISKHAHEQHVDLIVTSGRISKDEQYHSYTQIKELLRRTQAPVWIDKSNDIKRILCAIDGSDHSQKVLEQATSYAQAFQAELNVIHALAHPNINPLGLQENEIKRLEQEYANKQQQALKPLISNVISDQYNYQTRYIWGKPSHVILHTAIDVASDLIVMGTKGHNKLYEMFIGSTSDKVLHHTPCSLLLIN